MQRIRVGLTGLAVVLMLVFVATMVFNRFRAPDTPKSLAQADAEASADEPLADLGVAPGAASDNQSNSAAPKGQ